MRRKAPPKNCGYRRRTQTPDPYKAKVCTHCNLWFVPRPKEQVCDDCVPAKTRVKRLALARHTRTQVKAPRGAGQGHKSEPLGLTFKPGVPLWRVLALEAAHEGRFTARKSPPGTMQACEPDCSCDACVASRPKEYARGVAA